jgi:mannose-6-phosphate isomerase-like protein (cupin superfamily)
VARAARYIKLAKFKGEFVWHHHQNEDELFLVTKGQLLIKLRDGEVLVGPGEFVVIPCRVEHMPVAKDEVHVILIEPKTTLNTGNVVDEKTVEQSRKYEISHKGDAQNLSTGR